MSIHVDPTLQTRSALAAALSPAAVCNAFLSRMFIHPVLHSDSAVVLSSAGDIDDDDGDDPIIDPCYDPSMDPCLVQFRHTYRHLAGSWGADPRVHLSALLVAFMYQLRRTRARNPNFTRHWAFAVHACVFVWPFIDICGPLTYFAANAERDEGKTGAHVLHVDDEALRLSRFPLLRLLFEYMSPSDFGATPARIPARIINAICANDDACEFVLLAMMQNPKWTLPLALAHIGAHAPTRVWERVRSAHLRWLSTLLLLYEEGLFVDKFCWGFYGPQMGDVEDVVDVDDSRVRVEIFEDLIFQLLKTYYLGKKQSCAPPRHCRLSMRLGMSPETHVNEPLSSSLIINMVFPGRGTSSTEMVLQFVAPRTVFDFFAKEDHIDPAISAMLIAQTQRHGYQGKLSCLMHF